MIRKAILGLAGLVASGMWMQAEAQLLTPPPAGTNGIGPKIQFAEPAYDFGRIRNGDMIKHSFIFTNVGDQTLEVTHVQPSCGCTAAGEWTRKVEPGQTGQVPLQFNSANFNGSVVKTITVNCNDRFQPSLVLQIKGTIWKPIEVIPQFPIMNVVADASNASTVVRIVSNMEEPIQVSSPEINNRAFIVTLATNQPGKDYQVTVTTLPPMPPNSINAEISVKTSMTNTPVLKMPIWVNIQQPLVVIPAQVMLPQAPLVTRTVPAITIQNNTPNAITLSEPSINIPGVEVNLNTLQAGRLFSVTLAFPQGYEAVPGTQVVFTVKTTHPQYPEIRVPVTQLPRPAAPVPPSVPLVRPVPPPAPSAVPTPRTPTAISVPQPAPAAAVTR